MTKLWLCHVQEYVTLNRDAIRKIVKKFDKKLDTAEEESFIAALRERDDMQVRSIIVTATDV